MADTIQVIRVDGIVSRGDFKERDGHIWWWQPSRQDWIGLGDVIELTEKEGKRRHKLLDPSSEYRIRWLESEWEPVDA